MRRRRLAVVAGLAIVSALAGCSTIGGFTGALAGITTGAASSNPAVGVGVGIAVQAATDQVVQTLFRNMQAEEQNRIAALAGGMAIGERQPWDIQYALPFSDERGEVQVVGVIDNALADCRQVMFSVIEGKAEAERSRWFLTQTCRRSDGQWRWAAAEPAIERWGSLQ